MYLDKMSPDKIYMDKMLAVKMTPSYEADKMSPFINGYFLPG